MAKKGLPKRNKRPKKNGRVGAVSWSLRGFLVASSDVGSGIVKVGMWARLTGATSGVLCDGFDCVAHPLREASFFQTRNGFFGSS